MYVVTLIRDDVVLSVNHSHHTMGKTMRLAWELLGGIPQAEVCVRKDGDMVAWLHTNFRGELEEVEVYGPKRAKRGRFGTLVWGGTVVAMNPRVRMFQEVFAK